MSLSWPPLPYRAWQDTAATLQRYMQIVGKIRLGQTPLTNHYWNCALQLSARGLTTGPTPYDGRLFEIEFDLVDHRLRVRTADDEDRHLSLDGRPVAVFYRNLNTLLSSLGIDVSIDDHPVEIPSEAIPFHEDYRHAAYDREYVSRFYQILWQSTMLLREFSARFLGKQSPVHFFWGSFDLASTRFSGRRAPPNPEADHITREAYSHEVWSAGFWPGDERFPESTFYAYAAPPPLGFPEAHVEPRSAFWHAPLGEYLLPYEAMSRDRMPRAALLAFLQSTYEAAADLGKWDREELERPQPQDERGAPAPAPL
jgi:hypothetical protein